MTASKNRRRVTLTRVGQVFLLFVLLLQLAAFNTGEEGNWKLEAMITHRKVLSARFFEVFDSLSPDEFMETRPGVYPPGWGEWPLIMRMLRPLLDIATHIGQVNYARRQLDNPVKTP